MHASNSSGLTGSEMSLGASIFSPAPVVFPVPQVFTLPQAPETGQSRKGSHWGLFS